MTTMELIERGVGHNCLSDAYELGRVDMFEEILAELRNFICSDNRGSCDYFIVDQIESYMFALAEKMQEGAEVNE